MLTSIEIDHLNAAYDAGDSTYELAQRFGIRRETVVGHLERHGITRRGKPGLELDARTRRMIIELGACGTPVSAIARTFGLSDRVVARTLDQAGVVRRSANRARTAHEVEAEGLAVPSTGSLLEGHREVISRYKRGW